MGGLRGKCRIRAQPVPGASLAVHDPGGAGIVVVLLHGLGGHAMEWWPLVAGLASEVRAVAVDQRGHGASTTHPEDVSSAAFLGDAVAVIEDLDVGPVVLVGQSFGAHIALLVAASRPDLVSSLVLVEGGVGGGGEEASHDTLGWFASWPTPFRDATEATAYFGGGVAGEAWAAGLEQTTAGLVPRFDLATLGQAISAVHNQARWDEWASVRCPTLLVRGTRGFLSQVEADEMLARNENARLVVIHDAGHDVHLDAPEQLAAVVSTFVGPTRGASG